MKNKRVPEIQFPGFTEEWEERKLGEISDIKTGPFGSTLHAEDYVNAGVPIVTTEHFKKGHLPKTKCNIPQVSDGDYLRLKSYKLQEGDIVFSRVGSVDINALVTSLQDGWLFSGRVLRVRPQKQFYSDYLHYLLDTTPVRNDVISRAVGQTMPSISTEILKETKIMTSKNIDEQKRIASVLRTIDDTIGLHQQELTTLKQTKQGFLQKMFPKEGESVPEIRFPGFTGDWEQSMLGELSDVTKLAGFEFTNYINYSDEGNIPAIRGLNVKNGNFVFSDVKYIDNSDFSKLDRSKLLAGDIVFTYVGTVGEAAIVPGNVNWYLAPNVSRIRTESINPEYLIQLFMHPTFRNKEIETRIATSSQPALSMGNIRKFIITFPTIKEQTKIGKFFKQLDRTIALHQRELDTMKETKKAFLQKMFV